MDLNPLHAALLARVQAKALEQEAVQAYNAGLGAPVSVAAPTDDWSEFDPFGEESEAEASDDFTVGVWAMGGTPEVIDRVRDFARSQDDGKPWTPEALLQVRRLALGMLNRHVGRYDLAPEFEYDCIPYWEQDVDVYLVKGDRETLARLNEAMTALGGGLACMGQAGVDATAHALKVSLESVEEDRIHQGQQEEGSEGWTKETADECSRAFAEIEAALVPHPDSRPSPSDDRKRLRHNYGVRRAQLVAYGLPWEQADYIAERTAEKLRAGADIVQAIEEANDEWMVKVEDRECLDLCLKVREFGLSIPRLVQSGWHRDRAFFVATYAAPFVVAGIAPQTAFRWADDVWRVREDPELFLKVKSDLLDRLSVVRRAHAIDTLMKSGRERLSGALWIARVAADLCWEKKPGTTRLYRLSETTEMAFAEWSNMTRQARLDVRYAYFREVGEELWYQEAFQDEDWFTEGWLAEHLAKIDPDAPEEVVGLAVKMVQGGSSLQEAAEAVMVPKPAIPLGPSSLLPLPFLYFLDFLLSFERVLAGREGR